MNIDKKTIVAIVLCVVAVIVVVLRIRSGFAPSKPSARSGAKAKTATGQAVAQVSKAAVSSPEPSLSAKGYQEFISTLEESDIDFDQKKLRNPMTPLVREAGKGRTGSKGAKQPGPPIETLTNAQSLGYSIEGIVWDELEPLALINNQVVGVGDRLEDESLIVAITKKKVRFTRKGREYFLEFREE